MSTPQNIDLRLTTSEIDKVVSISYLPGINQALLAHLLDNGYEQLKAALLKKEAEKEHA